MKAGCLEARTRHPHRLPLFSSAGALPPSLWGAGWCWLMTLLRLLAHCGKMCIVVAYAAAEIAAHIVRPFAILECLAPNKQQSICLRAVGHAQAEMCTDLPTAAHQPMMASSTIVSTAISPKSSQLDPVVYVLHSDGQQDGLTRLRGHARQHAWVIPTNTSLACPISVHALTTVTTPPPT